MTRRAVEERAERRRSWPRRLARVALCVALLLLNLALALFLLRRTLLEPAVLARVAAELGAALNADVTIDELAGNWISSVRLRGVEIVGRDGSVIRRLEGGSLDADLSLLALATGDLAGVRRAGLHARRLVLDAAASTDSPTPRDPAPLPDLSALRRLAPQGLEVSVANLEVVGRDTGRTRKLAILLAAGRGVRVITIQLGEALARIRIDPGPTTSGQAEIHVDEPGRVLELLGIDNQLDGGRLRATLHARTTPPGVLGTVVLDGGRYRDRRLQRSTADFGVDPDHVKIWGADIDLPGLRIHGRQITIPLDDAGDPLARVAGALDLEVEDLTPYAELLPETARQLMPIRGHLQGRVGDGELVLQSCAVQADGARLLVRAGRIPLRGESLSGRLWFQLDVPAEKSLDLAGIGTCTLAGSLRGALWGSLGEPELTGTLRLAAGRMAGVTWDTAAGRIGYARQRWELGDLALHGVRLEKDTTGSDLRGSVAIDLRTAGRTDIEHDVRATVTPAWLELAGVPAEEIARLRAAEIGLRGTLAFGAGDFPELRTAIELHGLRVDDALGIDVTGNVTLDPDGTLTMQPLELNGSVIARAEGSVALGASGSVDLRCQIEKLDLDAWHDVLGLPGLPRGTIRLAAELNGSFRALRGTVELDVDCVDLGTAARAAWPQAFLGPSPQGPVQAHVRLRAEERLEIEDLRVRTLGPSPTTVAFEARGTLGIKLGDGFAVEAADRAAGAVRGTPLGTLRGTLLLQSPGVMPEAALNARTSFTIADDATAVVVEELHVGPGRIAGRLGLGASLAGVLGGSEDLSAAELSGSLTLDEVELGHLPPALFGPVTAAGMMTANLDLGGTVARPRPQLIADLRDGAVAVERLPPCDQITAHIEVDARRAQIAGRARFAGSEVTARAHLEAASSPLDGTALRPESVTLDGACRIAGLELDSLPFDQLGLPGLLPGQLAGQLDGDCTVGGTLAAPRPTGSWRLARGSAYLGGVQFDSVGAELEVADDALDLRSLSASCAGGVVQGNVRLETTLTALLDGSTKIAELPLRGALTLRELELDNLPTELTGLQDSHGKLDAELEITGKLGNLAPRGTVRLADAMIKVPGGPRIADLNASLRVEPDRIVLEALRGTLGANPVHATATLVTPSGSLHHDLGDAQLDATISGEDLLLYRAGGVKARATTDLRLVGSRTGATLNGTVLITSGKLIRRISLIPDVSTRGGVTSAEEGIVLGGLPEGLGSNIALDIAVQTNEPVILRTSVLNAELQTEFRVRGTASTPHLEGNISSQRGRLTFPGAKLRLDNLLLTFRPERPAFPDLLVRANGKRHGIEIHLVIKGRYDQPEVLLTSSPPIPPQELVILITTGALPKTLREMGRNQQLTLIGTYLAEEVFEVYFGSESTEVQEGILDRIRIESGRELSTRGQETWLFELGVTERFLLQAERDIYEDYNMGIGYRIRF